MHKEKQVPDALPVCFPDEEGKLRHRPTQGWTVDEAWILLHRSIYSPTVQPRVGRWRILHTHPWKPRVTTKQYWFVAQKSTLFCSVCNDAFYYREDIVLQGNHRKASVSMLYVLDRTIKGVWLEHGANVKNFFWFAESFLVCRVSHRFRTSCTTRQLGSANRMRMPRDTAGEGFTIQKRRRVRSLPRPYPARSTSHSSPYRVRFTAHLPQGDYFVWLSGVFMPTTRRLPLWNILQARAFRSAALMLRTTSS